MGVYGRGSEWRRWDLHVHTPDTALNNQFGSWDEYIAAIEGADPHIAVIGITDYATVRTYKKFLEYRRQRRMPQIALAIPNIEFRISPETQKGKGINLHVLISPDEEDHVHRIEEALTRLSLTRGGDNIPCTEQGLMRLGKLTKPDLASDPAAFEEGVRQFKVEFDTFREWYRREEWLSRNSLIAIASGSKDGASGLTDSGFLATRRELYFFSDIVFSGNPAERDSWLGCGGIPTREFRGLGVPKPVAHGSDAHGIDKLFLPDLNRYCWIKADPTFEGLRQTIYEPEDRIWIGESPPTTHDSRSVLESISISEASGWFEERELPLNPGLVAIIGLKGSGKTALADLIAFAGGAPPDPEDSFLARAGEHIHGLTVVLRSRDGSGQSAVVPYTPDDDSGLTVKYLSQRFVDRLCTGDTLSDQLRSEVEAVIFQHLPLEDRMEAEDFTQLRRMRTERLREERDFIRSVITENNRTIFAIEQRRSEILKKRGRRTELPRLLEGLKKALPKINDKATAAKLEELKGLNEKRKHVSKTIADLKFTRQQVQDLERKIAGEFRNFAASWGRSEKLLRKLGFNDESISRLSPGLSLNREATELSPDAALVFKNRHAQLDSQIKRLEGSPTKGTDGASLSAAALDSAIREFEKELQLDQVKKNKVLGIQQQERELTDELQKIESDFKWAETDYPVERREIQTQRLDSYLSYFQLVYEERAVLEELYSPLKEALSQQGEHERKLGMTCRVEVDSKAWIARGEELFDLRKSGLFRFDAIRNIATTDLLRAWQACDCEQIEKSIEQCIDLMKASENLRSQLKLGYQPIDVADWLFSVDHISITHGIQYEGKDLRSLSPGTKGIVLMILYLAVDRADSRPLIVDQPDENLDNQSTYEVLRNYFREAKKRRQIIIITHNPNLVVNTDAEQVIVAQSDIQANGLPYIRYSLGSLEALEADGPIDRSIREEVCRILEGGRKAFRMRQQRYGEDRS